MSGEYHYTDTFLATTPPEKAQGYLFWTLPCPLDGEIAGIIHIFMGLSELDRDKVRERFRGLYSGVLRAFGERMAILGVREISPERLLDGLIALVIEDFSPDYRETLLVLSLLYHSAVKISADLLALFEQAALLATPKSANLLRNFANNPQSIDKMGYIEGVDQSGFRYVRTW